jgi:hypothetical protein
MGSLVRPKIGELVFRLFDRPLHPEFFEAIAVRRVERGRSRVSVALTHSGHSLTWSFGDIHLTEVTATTDQDLPSAGLRFGHRLRGEHSGRCDLPRGGRYQMTSQVEILPPEQFLQVHEELLVDGARRGLICQFHSHHRLGLSPLGVVVIEPLPNCWSVSAFHTFPDELAVVKVQSLIETA